MNDAYRQFERTYLPSQNPNESTDKYPEPFVPGRDGQLVATIFYNPYNPGNQRIRVEREK